MKIRNVGEVEKIELQMTPMIDIVFQLLVFFIMTFKIVTQEGDFNIKMPLAAQQEGLPDENLLPPMTLELEADGNGNIANIVLNGERDFGTDFVSLNRHIISMLAADGGPAETREAAEIELRCDFNLRYEETVKAITAVTGHKDPQTNEIIKLIEKVKFAPPQETD